MKQPKLMFYNINNKIEYYKFKVTITYNINKMDNDMIIKETNVWGHFHNVRNVDKRLRLMKKARNN